MIHARNEVAPDGESLACAVVPIRTSKRILGLDWSRALPWSFEDITVHAGSFSDSVSFMREHRAMFGAETQPRFLVEDLTPAKRRFCEEMDVFMFCSADRLIGLCTAHPSDWSSYYIRTFAILPEFRERRFATEFERKLHDPLRAAGVDRFEAECSVANQAMMRLFISQGFLVTSTVCSERWGTMLRFTKFLRGDAERVFRQQYVYAPEFGRNQQPNERRNQ